MKLKKFKDISESYSPKNIEKILNLFDEWDLGIVNIIEGDFCQTQGIILPKEKHLKEYRVTLGEIYREENVLDDNGVDSIDELDEEDKKLINSFKELDYKTTFSVFLPSNTFDLKSGAIECASNYLKILSKSYDDVYTGSIDNNNNSAMYSDMKKFKEFLKIQDIQINNDNLEMLQTVDYRLYKDNKFVFELDELLEHKAVEFFNEWLKLI